MTESSVASAPPAQAEAGAVRNSPYSALAGHLQRATPGDRAALARMDPEALRPHQIAALSRTLLAAGFAPDQWSAQAWSRWALIVHGIALAGHEGADRLGRQLARAGVSEARVARLLAARGDAFRQLLPRILRLLAAKGVAPNWFELGELVLKEGGRTPEDAERAEQLRLRIAGAFFLEIASKNPNADKPTEAP